MELLFEIILELVFEGVTSSVSNKRVPLPVRIIAGIIVIGLFGGAAFLIIYASIVCFNSTEFKATPHKERLTALYASCLHIFRHLAQISLDGRVSPCWGRWHAVPEGLTDRPARLRSICTICRKI